jgi:hypothetical protein
MVWRCGMLRSQVIWRLASWRVAAMPRSRSPARSSGASGPAALGQRFPGLAVAHAAHRRQVGVQVAARTQGAHFVHKAFRQHGVKALGNALVQPGAVFGFQGKKGSSAYGVCASSSLFCSVKARQRLARHMPHLQRALDALAVAGRQAGGGGGVHAGQFGVQRGPALAAPGLQPRAHGGVGGGHVVNAVEQRLEIQHGAAHQQRQGAARADLGHEPLASCTNSAAL